MDIICLSETYLDSSIQSNNDFDSLSKNLEIILDKLVLNNPFMLVVHGNLTAKSKHWNPLDRTTYEGKIIETITSNFGLHQSIQYPKNILEMSASCIDDGSEVH